MTLFSDSERPVVEAVARLAVCNPFLPERIELERQALGDRFVPGAAVWHRESDWAGENPNVKSLRAVARERVEALRERLAGGARATAEELRLYREVAQYDLYHRYEHGLYEAFVRPRRRYKFPEYRELTELHRRFFAIPGVTVPSVPSPEHLFACFFQVRRAFHFTFHYVLGGSGPAARLRASTWESIFTHDMERYQRALADVMGRLTTLVVGPSGTGKELVARAIGMSRYLPFDVQETSFGVDFEESFFPLNLSALSPTLIESELFGHRRGSFTGAVEDHRGWLEVCPARGTVFLDEIGEVEPAIQVKLLRVLETRTFQRLGESQPRTFDGKLVLATNRDLAGEMAAGRFRRDLYYRLCADVVVTPTLAERLGEEPDELADLVLYLVRRIVPGEEEAESIAGEVVEWIATNLDVEYPWPGNVRELDQCVRNVLVRRHYHPAAPPPSRDATEELAGRIARVELTADELLGEYCAIAVEREGGYLPASRKLDIDRRTVKAKADAARGTR